MRRLIVTLLMAVALFARGQTNLTPEQIKARRAENQRRIQEMTEKLNKATAQALALQQAAAARRLTNPPVSGDPERFVTPLYTNRPPLIITNGPVPIQALEILERWRRGASTNVPRNLLYDPYTNASTLESIEYFRTNRSLPAALPVSH